MTRLAAMLTLIALSLASGTVKAEQPNAASMDPQSSVTAGPGSSCKSKDPSLCRTPPRLGPSSSNGISNFDMLDKFNRDSGTAAGSSSSMVRGNSQMRATGR